MLYFWIIIIYLIILIGVGAYRSRKVKSQDDFMVAGRKLSTKVLVGTLLATWIGSGSIISSAGLAYEQGFPALWFDAGVWAAIIILYFMKLYRLKKIYIILKNRPATLVTGNAEKEVVF